MSPSTLRFKGSKSRGFNVHSELSRKIEYEKIELSIYSASEEVDIAYNGVKFYLIHYI